MKLSSYTHFVALDNWPENKSKASKILTIEHDILVMEIRVVNIFNESQLIKIDMYSDQRYLRASSLLPRKILS